MRLFHALLLIPLFTAPAFAETAAPPAAGSHARRGAEQHFADANTSHDGRLTLDQAKLGFKSIARSFPQIDVNRRGLHDEGSVVLRGRLLTKIIVDADTARRLFTLLCALHWKG